MRHVVRGLWLAIGMVLATILAACGGPPIALTGVVTDSYTGQPVSSANITLGDASFTTDAQGRYQIERWSTKDTLQIVAPGYASTTIALESQPQLNQPTPPSVTVDARLRPNGFTGKVTDLYTGKPVANVAVTVGDQRVTSGPDGAFTLQNLPEQFSLAISADQYEALTQQIERKTVAEFALRPNSLAGVITNRYTGKPVANATVSLGAITATTSSEGRYQLANVPEQGTLVVKADGFAELSQAVERTTVADLALRPDVIASTIVDAATGKPVTHATVIATPQERAKAVASIRLDGVADGSFKLEGVPEQGFIQVLAPGYRKAVIEVKENSVPDQIKLEPFKARALYVTAPSGARRRAMESYFDAIEKTELNAIVLDLKSDLWGDLGLIYYDSQVPIVKELGTARPIMDLEWILSEAKKRNIYMIARIHIFSHDNVLAEARPEWAGRDTQGRILASRPTSEIFYYWLDPWNRNVWDYNIQLGVEAAMMGFDEVNFDYIRFPDLDPKTYVFSKPTDPINNPDAMFDNIAEFAKTAQAELNNAGAFFSVDVFGYAALRPMWEIGQNIVKMAPYTDYIMPMIYPSHYNFGEFGFEDPSTKPYETVQLSLKRGWQFVDGQRAKLRPWLQEFTLIWRQPVIRYGVPEVRAQIDATESFPEDQGWAMWDPDGIYDETAFKPE